MCRLYQDGVVARVVERMAAVAARLDDDGQLSAWIFANRPERLPPLTIGALPEWIEAHASMYFGSARSRQDSFRPLFPVEKRKLGFGNDEPKVIRAVLDWVDAEPAGPPVLVLFFSDGGVYHDEEIERLLRVAADKPVFWQFVGLGDEDYGVLQRLDTLAGRVVDNCGFFAVDDIDAIDDEQLYERLLVEFPVWLKAARAAGILP